MEPPEDGAAEETARPEATDRSASSRSSGLPENGPIERGGMSDEDEGDAGAVDGDSGDGASDAGVDEGDADAGASVGRGDAGADGVDAGVDRDDVSVDRGDAGADHDADGRDADADEVAGARDPGALGPDGWIGSGGYDDADDGDDDGDHGDAGSGFESGADHPEDGDVLDGTEELGGISGLSVTSRLIVAVVVAAVAVGALFHLGMVFLSISPANTLSDEYSQQVNDYVLPEFEQNWKLFAPNPVQENTNVEVRAEIRESNGSLKNTGWTDLTAMDLAKIRHDPIPSHTVQNELRRAWSFYTDTHDGQDRAIGVRGDLSQEYMLHIVAGRLGPRLNGDPVQELQVRVATEPLGSPPWDSEKIPTTTSYRVLPWWAVTAEDYT